MHSSPDNDPFFSKSRFTDLQRRIRPLWCLTDIQEDHISCMSQIDSGLSFDLESYLRRVGLYLKLPPVADHLELDLSLLTEKGRNGFNRKCIVCQEDNPELITFFVPIYNKKDQEIIEIIIQQLWQYLSLMKSLGASVVFRESEIPELGEEKMPKDEADVSCLSRVVKTLNETYEEKYRKIFRLRQ